MAVHAAESKACSLLILLKCINDRRAARDLPLLRVEVAIVRVQWRVHGVAWTGSAFTTMDLRRCQDL